MSEKITKYLKPKEVSETYNVPLNTLRKWRCQKRGLPYIVIGRIPGHKRSGNIFYDRAAVEEYFNRGFVNVR
jgi:hypothetical protein